MLPCTDSDILVYLYLRREHGVTRSDVEGGEIAGSDDLLARQEKWTLPGYFSVIPGLGTDFRSTSESASCEEDVQRTRRHTWRPCCHWSWHYTRTLSATVACV